jgi:peptide/nickel transport system permease protein
MLRYITFRLGRALVVLFLISVFVFMMTRLIPGDPAALMLGRGASPEAIASLRAAMGLDRPAYTQYFAWIGNALTGDLGTSMRLKTPVVDMVLERYPRTLSFVVAGSLISIAFSLTLGVLTAVRHNSTFDLLVTSGALLGVSIPGFWLGILLILVFSVQLGWLPTSGYASPAEGLGEYLKHLAMPGFTLGIAVGAIMTRFVRASLVEVLYQNYITTAKGKGLGQTLLLFRHAIPNMLIPVVTVFGIQMGYMLGGSVIIEEVFAYPGIGQLVVDSIFRRDYPLVQAAVLAYAITFIIVNLITDIAYGLLDPRVRATLH